MFQTSSQHNTCLFQALEPSPTTVNKSAAGSQRTTQSARQWARTQISLRARVEADCNQPAAGSQRTTQPARQRARTQISLRVQVEAD